MAMTKTKTGTKMTKNDKPLFTIPGPVPARAYRATFKPFEAMKYLDVAALSSKRKVFIECGTLEVAGTGTSYTVSAEIRNGALTALRPLGCTGCDPKSTAKKKPGKAGKLLSHAAMSKLMGAVDTEIKSRGLSTLTTPIPLKAGARFAINIPIGPIVITIGDLGEDGWDACVTVYIPGVNICWCCIFNGCHCY